MYINEIKELEKESGKILEIRIGKTFRFECV